MSSFTSGSQARGSVDFLDMLFGFIGTASVKMVPSRNVPPSMALVLQGSLSDFGTVGRAHLLVDCGIVL